MIAGMMLKMIAQPQREEGPLNSGSQPAMRSAAGRNRGWAWPKAASLAWKLVEPLKTRSTTGAVTATSKPLASPYRMPQVRPRKNLIWYGRTNAQSLRRKIFIRGQSMLAADEQWREICSASRPEFNRLPRAAPAYFAR